MVFEETELAEKIKDYFKGYGKVRLKL